MAIGVVIALALAVVLIGPILPQRRTGGSSSKPCALSLVYEGQGYVARAVTGRMTQSKAIGVGVARGCGVKPSDVGLRSIEGVPPSVAVGVGADATSLYVRRDVCARVASNKLLSCLRRSR